MKAAWQSVASVAISTMPSSTRSQVERGGDGLDDRVERLVFALYAGQSVAAARHR